MISSRTPSYGAVFRTMHPRCPGLSMYNSPLMTCPRVHVWFKITILALPVVPLVKSGEVSIGQFCLHIPASKIDLGLTEHRKISRVCTFNRLVLS